jgi:4'-phosphopantetheinyl transferase
MPSALDPPTDSEIHVWRVELDGGGRAAARAALRGLLGDYLGTAEPPALTVGSEGKPRLAEAPERLSFNLSHSGEVALVAVTVGAVPVGVDVERLRARRNLPRLAARWLPAEDAAAVAGAGSEEERERRFYEAWTRHEARVKCAGGGLAGPVPGPEVRAWPLEVGTGYAAAVAIDAAAEPRILLRDAACRR